MTMIEDHRHPSIRRYEAVRRTHSAEPLMTKVRADDPHTLATALGVSLRHASRLIAHGLTDLQADRYACRIGFHPSVLWPGWWDIEPDVDEGPDGIMRPSAS